MNVSVAIAGAAGRMGRALLRATIEASDLRLAGGVVRAGSTGIGQDLGELAGLSPFGIRATSDVAAAGADVWVDFTNPTATLNALALLVGAAAPRAAIIGATGFSPEEEAKLASYGERLALVRASNFSLGVSLLASLVRQAASKLTDGWDIEIIEAHHRRKVDAPSGTALTLGDAAAKGRGADLGAVRLAPRDGATGARPEGGIGFAVVRGGGIIGAHDVVFASEHEVLTLSHQALDRSVFAHGALAAARWAAGKPPGLYSMSDVLGLA